MFALDFLGVLLPHVMLLGIEMPLVGPPPVRVKLRDAEGLQQRLQPQEDLVLPPSEHISHIPHPSDGDPHNFPGAFFARTAHPNSGMLSSHERRYTKRLRLRSVVWGSFYRPSKRTRSNICPL